MKWSQLVKCAAMIAGLVATILPAAAQKDTNTLVWGMVTKPRHLNSAVQSGTATGLPAGQLFASPLLANDKWEMEPYLAESFKFEDNNRSLVLKVRKGATFHDGKPITSADFAFSIMAVKAHHPFQGMMSAVERVDTPDPDTAIIRLSQPHPVILLALTSPFCPILPKHIFDNGQDLKTHPRNMDPVGSGPFKLVEFKPGQHVIMERNKDFFVKGAPKLDRVIIRFFADTNAMGLAIEAKEVHYAAFIPDISVIEKLSTVPGITVNSKGGDGVGPLNWLAFNTARAPFNDPKVRQALSFAIDREFITKRLHRGRSVAATGPITPTSPYATVDVEPYKVDLAKAERLLDEAGLKKGPDGIRLKTTITYQPGNRDLTQNVVEYLKAQFRRIGVDLAITPAADFPTWSTKVSNFDFDMTMDAVFNWGDPLIGVHRTYLSTNVRKGVIWSNTQGYANPKVDELLNAAAIEPDLAKRKAHYAEFQKIVVADAPIAFLHVIPYFSLHSAGLKNFPTGIWSASAPISDMYWE